MKRTYLLPMAYLIDSFAGDPEWFPHPVRFMGMAITNGERVVRRSGDNACREFFAGTALAVGVIASSYYLIRIVLRLAYRRSQLLGCSAEMVLAWTCLAARNLQQEEQAVSEALRQEDIVLARERLGRIVGRDTHSLDENEISRALIETLAESASDGVVAPILYLAMGVVPLAMAYKAVNTLDSMIGHRDPRYLYFGKAAARIDDAANYIPSRVTALSMIAASALLANAGPRAAWDVWLRDGGKHKSPNAGQPEAAMSGALRVRLGGDNRYDGELISSPRMGEEFPDSSPAKAREAIRLTTVAGIFGLAVGLVFTAVLRRGNT
jgi:adenosylcobinamide-phosphate synthase